MVFAIFKTYDHSDDLVHGGGGDTGQAFAGLLKREKKIRNIFWELDVRCIYYFFPHLELKVVALAVPGAHPLALEELVLPVDN